MVAHSMMGLQFFHRELALIFPKREVPPQQLSHTLQYSVVPSRLGRFSRKFRSTDALRGKFSVMVAI
jgi:hypothetical protein